MNAFKIIRLALGAFLIGTGNLRAEHIVSTTNSAVVQPYSNPLTPDYAAAPLQDWEKKFSAFEFKTSEENGHILPYRFYKPGMS
jgi:hypothetical protein